MKTLITGGTGLVGTSISQGIKLSSKDGDLRDWNQTLEIFTTILHA
jgi:dTDP-4-dehydrorhamnose reductase